VNRLIASDLTDLGKCAPYYQAFAKLTNT